MFTKSMCHRAARGAVVAFVLSLCLSMFLASSRAEAQAKDTTKTVVVNAMKGDLRRLVSANEVYKAKHKTYASSVSDLEGFKPSAGVSIDLSGAGASGWSATATSSALPEKSCVIYVGKVATHPKTATQSLTGAEAVAVCDKP